MADINDLANLMQSVDIQIKEQTGILRSILTLQEREAGRAERRWQLSRADRDVAPPAPEPDAGGDQDPTPPTPPNNTLAGLLGGLTALFGEGMLKRFALLAGGAAALAASVALTIGVVKGQMTAIETFFKAFAPGLVKIFDDFKVDLSARFTAVSTSFAALVDDLKIRVAFIRVSVAETFDNFANTVRNMFSAGADAPESRFSRMIASIRTSIDVLIEPFRVALTTIQELAGPEGSPSKIAEKFKNIKTWIGSLGAQIGRIASVVGKIFAPIAILMTAWDTIKGALDGYAEDGFLGGLKGAIDGFFTSLITVPLDLVKNLVAWVAEKFGFDETAEVLREFSFTELFKQITASIFAGVESAINVIKDLFTFGEEDMTLLGALGKLTDLVYAPINMAINFVRGLFGFEETDEPFRLQDWIIGQFNKIIDSVKEMFAFIPSVDELKTMMFNSLPEWMQKLIGGETVRGSLPQDNYENPVENYGGGAATGTRGFVDFGSGTNMTLHGLEAVVPRNTDAGQFLEKNFDNAWRMKFDALENTNQTPSQPIIVNAPNNSQTNVSSSGGTSSTIINSFGSGRSDLDAMSRPAGAF
jgi:hypothetical protein